nr:STM4014 family protein [Streptacidiphilus melanogenes]
MSTPASVRFAVVGVPGNRRVEMFAEAVRAAGLDTPLVVPWLEVLTPGAADRPVLPPGCLVRVDSPGEDEAVDRLLRGEALGGGWAPTRVEGGAAWYAGFRSGLRTLADAVAATPDCRLLADPDDIAVMFDKRLTHARLAAADVPVPPVLLQGAGGVSGWEELRQLLREQRMPRVFVKPAHGSSGSGVVALELGPDGQATATTSAQLTTTADGAVELFNSLRVRRYRDESELRALFDALASERLHVERWLPKAAQGGRPADLRVVVTAGRATHLVVRTSSHPMTNLHLGGSRGDVAQLREAVGARWSALLETAEQAAACFPGSPSVGVDILPATGWQRFRVGEVNAFGDLLPGLTGLPGSGAEGLDTYAAFVTATTSRLAATPSTSHTGIPRTTTHRELIPCP